MLTYCIGIAFLIFCVFGVPLLRKLAHEQVLRQVAIDGVTLIPRFWTLSGLRLERSRWSGEMAFRASGPTSGRPGHLRLVATFKHPMAIPAAAASGTKVETGDPEFDARIRVEGDPVFAKKVLVPEMRLSLVELDRMGGHLLSISGSTIEIDGPLFRRPEELKTFVELCDSIITRTAESA